MSEKELSNTLVSPYIFVSYSHDDSESVHPEIARARDLGIQVWYDEGIKAGSSWRDDLAEKIHDCALFVFFVSPQSVTSQHCLREVNYAEECGKPIIAIYLERTELPRGLHMGLADRQAILKYELSSSEYLEKLQTGIEAVFGEIALLQTLNSAPTSAVTRRHRPLVWVGAIAVVVVISFLIVTLYQQTSVKAPLPEAVAIETEAGKADIDASQSAKLAIAVLPFVNMSSDAENEYFSDGISEEILDALVKTRTIDVIARTSSFQFKGKNQNIQEIAEVLDVSHVLEGSVRKSGNRVRITAQLIEASSGVHLWSHTYDRELIDVFGLQDEIATTIVDEIESSISGLKLWDPQALQARGILLSNEIGVHPNAYELYLRAMNTTAAATTQADYLIALGMLKQATQIDPEFSSAWMLIALFHWHNSDRSNVVNASLARPALEKVLSLSPDNPRALATSGIIKGYVDLQWDEAEALIRRAVELAPSEVGVRMSLSGLLTSTNRRLEGLEEIEFAYQLDPLNYLVATTYIQRLWWASRRQDAERIAETLQNIQIKGLLDYENIVSYFIARGDVESAEQHLQILRNKYSDDNVLVKIKEWQLAELIGDLAHQSQLASELSERQARGEYVPAYDFSPERFQESIESSVRNREFQAPFILLALTPWEELAYLRDRMNLGSFEVRSLELASEKEKAAVQKRRVRLSREKLDEYSGIYIHEASFCAHTFYRKADALMFDVSCDGFQGEAIPLADNHFTNECCIRWEYFFEKNASDSYRMVIEVDQIRDTNSFLRVLSVSPDALQQYTGRFISSDARELLLDIEHGKLMAQHDNDAFELHPVSDDGTFLAIDKARVTFSDDRIELALADQTFEFQRAK
jgi:TolB-like protein/tetratricopeptide (TPR) repeat protein